MLEDRTVLELQSGSEHRTTGSQEEQHEQEDGEREEARMDVDFPESWNTTGDKIEEARVDVDFPESVGLLGL